MNYTENYHLPQWEETDRIMRTDFNQMCADIDEGIAEAKETAGQALEHKNYVIGTYTGTGSRLKITLGFKPAFLIIGRQQYGDEDRAAKNATFTFTREGLPDIVTLDSDGFTVCAEKYRYPTVNAVVNIYYYIAFR